jgi:hypothetical protein
MSGHPIVFIQTGSGGGGAGAPASQAAQPASPALPAQPGQAASARDQIRDQVRQSLQEAARAAAEGRRAAAEGQRAAAAAGHPTTVVTIDGRPVVIDEPFQAPGFPGISVHSGMEDMIPARAVDIAYGFFIMLAVIIIGWPLARAIGRRLERRAEAPALPDAALGGQLQRIEQAVEAMSIEIERISESQRFMARLQSGAVDERAAVGSAERR